MVILSIGVFLDNVISLLSLATANSGSSVWMRVFGSVSKLLLAVGTGSVITNVLQLAIEQIPEASASQLSSLMSWFVFSGSLGWWLNSSVKGIYVNCIAPLDVLQYQPILKLIFSSFLSFALNFLFLFKHKLLDNSPTSNTSRMIYAILKYANKHKHPERRSALTYWEDVPVSRLSLGKRKYGGLFTNEQVEDVKTFIRMSVFFLGFIFFISSLYLHGYSLYYINSQSGQNHSLHPIDYVTCNPCTKFIIYSFTGDYSWWVLVFTLTYELILVPVLSYRMPSMLQRLIIASLVSLLLVIFLRYYNNYYRLFSLVSGDLYLLGLQVSISFTIGAMKSIFFVTTLEFICAQSPYTMRNFFICFANSAMWCCPILSYMVFAIWKHICTDPKCCFAYTLFSLVLCIISFILFSLSIKLYHKRSRGQEDEHQQRWVEEVYGKYVAEDSSSTRAMNNFYSSLRQ